MIKPVVAAFAAVVAGIALRASPSAFATVVVVVSVLVVGDLGGLIDRAGARAVTLTAIGPAVGLPIAVALDPAVGWQSLSACFVVMVIASFAMILAFGRRRDIVSGLSATAVLAVLIGLGASGVLLLARLPNGSAWVGAFGLSALTAGGARAVVAGRLVARRSMAASPTRGGRRQDYSRPLPNDAVAKSVARLPTASGLGVTHLAPVCAVIPLVGAGVVTLNPPFSGAVAAGLAGIVLAAGVVGNRLVSVLRIEAGMVEPTTAGRVRLGDGLLLDVIDVVLLGAPLAYLLARVVEL